MNRLVIFALLAIVAMADIYMHNPRGSNGKNRERNDNRANDNRICDTQNNAAGGYQYCGSATKLDSTDGNEFYGGSELRIEWTSQHSCGPDSNSRCQTVLQYACDDDMPNMGDGYPSSDNFLPNEDNNAAHPEYQRGRFVDPGQNDDGTNTIPIPNSIVQAQRDRNGLGPTFGDDLDTDVGKYTQFYNGDTVDGRVPSEFGRFETFEYYKKCLDTSRNMGLYLADQRLNSNKNTARFTRQDTGGTRYGLECPEERDYYPYWRPSPWKDIAIFVTDVRTCGFYKKESFNVKARYECVMSDAQRQASPGDVIPIDQEVCETQGGTWTRVDPHRIQAPDCQFASSARDNHLGNVAPVDGDGSARSQAPETQHYNWQIPKELSGRQCVIRMRYNISTTDYASMGGFKASCIGANNDDPDCRIFDSSFNCEGDNSNCIGYDATTSPRKQDPYVETFPGKPKISLSINTDQTSRTFQDRSFVFRVKNRPSNISGRSRIYNLNVRGRRGNIVQTYPAVEYDFVPQTLSISAEDYVHVQFCGSDFNTNRNGNNGNGWRRSDRSNIMQMRHYQENVPLPLSEVTMFQNEEVASAMAYAGIDLETADCIETDNDDDYKNCGFLNPAPARFEYPPLRFSPGTYHYMSSRNNNFSNRSHKGTMHVSKVRSTGEIIAVVFGTLFGVGIASAGGLFLYTKKNPTSSVARFFSRSGGTATGPLNR